MTKYIFVTGGVVSGLGKGITAASLGRLLKARGLKVEQTVPEGLMPDPHFSTNPAKVRFEPDLKDYPAPLVKAYQNREKENPGK